MKKMVFWCVNIGNIGNIVLKKPSRIFLSGELGVLGERGF
jgi:hypothetical protein